MAKTKDILIPGINDSAVILYPQGHELNSPESQTEYVDTPAGQGPDFLLGQVKAMVRGEMAQQALEGVEETPEDAFDFDVKDEFDDDSMNKSKYMETEFPQKVVNQIRDAVLESMDAAEKERSDQASPNESKEKNQPVE